MPSSDTIQFYAATDVGRDRDHNEDNFLVDKKLALSIVADGMGGHAAGEVASALAVRIIHEEVKKQRVTQRTLRIELGNILQGELWIVDEQTEGPPQELHPVWWVGARLQTG